jgi:hypothetical protein
VELHAQQVLFRQKAKLINDYDQEIIGNGKKVSHGNLVCTPAWCPT